MGEDLDNARALFAGRLPGEGRTSSEQSRLASLAALLAARPLPAALVPDFPDFPRRQARLARALADPGFEPEALEERILEAYAALHGHALAYSAEERALLDRRGGYWAHAGGLTPILKAPDWLRRDSVGVDFGAANGLQGLLIQWLRPHRLFVQVEISRRALDLGRGLQRWLEIPGRRVAWRAEDVCDAARSAADYDFIYLYRPVRPEGAGLAFYERLRDALEARPRPTAIFSIADALAPFLPPRFRVTYDDGQLSCFYDGDSVPRPAG